MDQFAEVATISTIIVDLLNYQQNLGKRYKPKSTIISILCISFILTQCIPSFLPNPNPNPNPVNSNPNPCLN